ncbi:sigma 54 modulation/S30EA ribosomal C-terminal domain-containing protein [Streptacidiphilus rugosus]|uniref:sigma 54 modulation/S30EA ribosomal C-terminal domain-containing protein n=1 Tax=Streptacidiphilus rugosus TaxID=405783 RepID=UPI000569FCFB|nr:sigma 54 modulation/S30EA ribosomal C-terminal domain-containing protein [Streptacidiphilus rugosus]
MTDLHSPAAVDIVVETRGPVSLAAPDYARAKLLSVAECVGEPVLALRVKLTQETSHAVAQPSRAQATVDLDGRPVRAHVRAATMQEAVDQLQQRLRSRIARVRQHRDHGRDTVRRAGAVSWEQGDDRNPQPLPRATGERRVKRHKSYSLARQTPWSAVFEMEAMDYDFHLFTDARTGRDSVVYRDTDTDTDTDGYALVSTGPETMPEPGMALSRLGAPELTVRQAIDRLDLSGRPFTFFTETVTGRGNLLYHRYDGDYGLITPVQE